MKANEWLFWMSKGEVSREKWNKLNENEIVMT